LVGDDGACPYFWPIGTKGKYMLLYFSHKSGGKYLIGDYDKDADKFYVTDGGNFNHGPSYNGGIHAPSAFPDGKGGIVVIFNTNTGKTVGAGNYTEMMTLPRLLTLDDNNNLQMTVAGDVESIRGEKTTVNNVALPANKEVALTGISGDAMEMNMTIDLKTSSMVEVNVLCSPNKEEYTRILFYKNGGYPLREFPGQNQSVSAIAIDNSMSSTSSAVKRRVVETADVAFESGELLNVRIFIDKSIVEVFVNNKQCVAVRVYPEREDSKGVSVCSRGADALVQLVDAWKMNNIYCY